MPQNIYILCPGGLVTGGPELLHQLADALNRSGHRAFMLYAPLDRTHETPAPYLRYSAPAAVKPRFTGDDIVVMPEVFIREAARFAPAKVYFWWLSVDNFYVSVDATRLARYFGKGFARRLAIWRLRKHVDTHLYQSEYARLKLVETSLSPAAPLSDYLAEEFLEAISAPSIVPREDIVAFNPAKGKTQTDAIFAALERDGLPLPRLTPIVGMSREEIRDLLSRAKVYIDFGNHPGKDRIPREAAAMGACILVNKRGSASNPIDIPIPARFKIDDSSPEFAKEAAAAIRSLLADFASASDEFSSYRRYIAEEPARFLEQVSEAFPS
jgi:hypothetical protein